MKLMERVWRTIAPASDRAKRDAVLFLIVLVVFICGVRVKARQSAR